MTPDQRQAVLDALRLENTPPEHDLRSEGVPFVSGPVWRQRVSYAVPGGRRLSAWILRPATGRGPWPGVLALHPHTDAFDQGGDEVAGQQGRPEHHYGVHLAARGFVVLCPDLPCFGQQQAPNGVAGGRSWEDVCLLKNLAHGRSLLAESLDQLQAAAAALLDFEATADLNVAALGFGLGARMAAWLAFVDRRVGAVWLHAGLGQHRVLLEQGRMLPKHVVLPGLLALGVDQADIVADILPRAVGISFGRNDRVAPPEATTPVLDALRERAQAFPQARIEILTGDYDHRFPREMLDQAAERLLAWMR